jgi:hypothetical protein
MTSPDSRGRALLALFLFGSGGSLAELVLLEHVDSATQWVPLALLAAGVLASGALLVLARGAAHVSQPGTSVPANRPRFVRAKGAWTLLLALYVVAGPIGITLHLKGNLEFERELDATLGGFALWREVLMGATPALAPGAMTLLGIVGWLATRPPPAG